MWLSSHVKSFFFLSAGPQIPLKKISPLKKGNLILDVKSKNCKEYDGNVAFLKCVLIIVYMSDNIATVETIGSLSYLRN